MNHRNPVTYRILLVSTILILFSLAFTFPNLTLRKAQAAPNYLHTAGSKIVDSSGRTVAISGLNWFGFETANNAPHGLWQRSYTSMLDQIKSLGYNALRIPFSNAMLRPGVVPSSIDYTLNSDLKGLTSLQVLDKIIEAAGQRGIKVILDDHRSTPGGGPESNGLWYTSDYPESTWIEDWKMLAARYKSNPTVIGMDLRNEPHGDACWGCGNPATDWRLAAEKAGNAILAINPNLLIIVEGISNYNGQGYWWGGNLMGAKEYPVRLNVANRVVYSPHDYPASVSYQSYFGAPSYPKNLPGIWDQFWGYLASQNTAPVLIGEWGTRYETQSDQTWMQSLASYVQSKGLSYTFWSLNPDSGDTGGLLKDDWISVQEQKQAILSKILYPFIDSGSSLPDPTQPAATPTQPPAKPTPTPTGQTVVAVEDFQQDSANNWTIFKDSGSTITKSVVSPGLGDSYSLKVAYNIASYGGTQRLFAAPQDWSGAKALRFGFYGHNSGNRIRVEIFDNRAAGSTTDSSERFEAILSDNFTGWRTMDLPWSAFIRRQDWQPVNAPNDGLTLRQVWGLDFSPLAGQSSFQVDQIGLVYQGPVPTQQPAPQPTPQPAPTQPALPCKVLDDFESGNTGKWSSFQGNGSYLNSFVTAPGQQGSYAFQANYGVFNGGWCGAGQYYSTPQDWRSYRQFSFSFNGNGSGNSIRLELLDNRAPGSTVDNAERFEFIFRDDTAGWRTFNLPWSAFTRRGDWQPVGAPNDGLSLDQVWGIDFAPLSGSGSFQLDEIKLVP